MRNQNWCGRNNKCVVLSIGPLTKSDTCSGIFPRKQTFISKEPPHHENDRSLRQTNHLPSQALKKCKFVVEYLVSQFLFGLRAACHQHQMLLAVRRPTDGLVNCKARIFWSWWKQNSGMRQQTRIHSVIRKVRISLYFQRVMGYAEMWVLLQTSCFMGRRG